MTVVASLEDLERLRCVDLVQRPDGSFFFSEYRRDPEDGGRWTLITDYSDRRFATKDEALRAAEPTIHWFGELMKSRRAAASGSPLAGPAD